MAYRIGQSKDVVNMQVRLITANLWQDTKAKFLGMLSRMFMLNEWLAVAKAMIYILHEMQTKFLG